MFAAIKSRTRLWGLKIGEYYSGSVYPCRKSALLYLFDSILSRVKMDEEHAENLKALSEKGVVVHALKNRSQLNCLILQNLLRRKGIKAPEYCCGVNMIFWQPFPIAFKAMISGLFNDPHKREFLKRMTERKKSSVIYLRDSEFIGSSYAKDPLIHLIHAQKRLSVPVFLVPDLVAYGRRREKKNKTLVDLLFGQTENPGMIRRLITFLRHSNMAFVISSEPVNLLDFLEVNSDKPQETIVYLLRRELIDRIDSEKRSIVGPVLKSREEIIGMVLRDEGLVEFIKSLAKSADKNYNDIIKEAKKYLFEIAADYNETYIGFWNRALTWLWNNIYDGVIVDKEGLAGIRNLSKKMPFVVVPCHRSHIDYLLISYVFYNNNIQLPFIAAGSNLMFWPLGHIFRKSGAFFIRRSFKDNELYGKVFAKYIKVLLKEGLPMEFFIEGGRSRTGKMVMPKYGLLSTVIQAYKEGNCDDLAIIPVFIGYDRVIEEKSYLKELGGAKKEKEKVSSLIKSGKLLKRRYGSVYLNVGKSISLKSYLSSEEIPIEEMDLSEKRGLYRKIGYEVVREINDASVVTPSSLVSAGLLCHYKRGISHNDLMNILNEFYKYLTYRRVNLSSTFANREKTLNDALTLLESSGFISKMGPEEDDEDELKEVIYSIERDSRMNLEYYKNNVLHFFVSLSFVATSILSGNRDKVPLSDIIEDYGFFKKLFKHEFIFDEKADDMEEVKNVLSYIYDTNMILGHEDGEEAWIEVKGRGRRNLSFFAGLIHNYIESYWITIRSFSYLKNKARQEKDLLRKIQKLGTRMYKTGEISKAEALSRSNYQNALDMFIDTDLIRASYGSDENEKKKEAKLLSLAGNKGEMEDIRHKLFGFM